ncbi:uncharacterized protein K444DRAFT_403057 [Hyaloscypha bicolor E]|uniref:Protein kinase domain-containing protein n=1 Tax=Hyaloscypha bicolor E TaxID=1095630 RepID=A0A2J6TAB9_9HELO|nr:uncharacterized protein K444DRAFT_403057 [Hyaloscypha bicolor E]PMD59951.1 hypothetical protein K444DRAFT_403057 [Hyaloscypha bicolor E]
MKSYVELAREGPSRGTSGSPASKDPWGRPFSFATIESIGRGASGMVFDIDASRVIKVFAGDEGDEKDELKLAREKIFDELQRHGSQKFTIRYVEGCRSGLVLERLVGTLRERLQSFSQKSWEQRSLGSCKGLPSLHEHKGIYGDIGHQNILVGDGDHVKLCDFAGSRIGDDAWAPYDIYSQDSSYFRNQPTVATEIFAVGSLLYKIWNFHRPYRSKKDAVVQKGFHDRAFPLVSIRGLRNKIISKYYDGGYHSVYSGVWSREQ